MWIEKIKIVNFKCFNGVFVLNLNEKVNVLVGNNEIGKSTILEAIHLTLSGLFSGRFIKNELTQYLFNKEVVTDYIVKINSAIPIELPEILIELHFKGENLAKFEGKENSEKLDSCGVLLKIHFDNNYIEEYEAFVKAGNVQSLPIEFYCITWKSFAQEELSTRNIPIKSVLIDSSSTKLQSGSDIYISKIVKDNLDAKEIVGISQAHRTMRDSFIKDPIIKAINEKIKDVSAISNKKIELSVELLSKNAWENSLMTYLDEVPFHYLGKGEQCVLKTKLALGNRKAKEASVILMEEPENHLTFSNLNRLIKSIKNENPEKQIIITTHSSFVANKLGLDNLILLNGSNTLRLNDLNAETKIFFEKIAGYDTLRLILSNKAILVEGDSDELVVQKAFMAKNEGTLPIENGIDVISVGTSFLRFLEISEKINKPTVVMTDNDGNVEALQKKYENYLGSKSKDFIKISYDSTIDTGNLKIGDTPFNYNTLEPKIVKKNSLEKMNSILGKSFSSLDELHLFMKQNKTDCALKIFNAAEDLEFPEYILDAIK